VFSACGAGNMNQMHIHEMSTYTILFDANTKTFFSRYQDFNKAVEELERRGREDLLRQGMTPDQIHYRLELDMRYGNQRVQTAVVTELTRLKSQADVLKLIDQFYRRYGDRFGEGSQSPEAGVRINTIRVCSFVEQTTVTFAGIKMDGRSPLPVESIGTRQCHFAGHDGPVETRLYDERALVEGSGIPGPALVTTRATTYLIEPGWKFHAAAQGAVWFIRDSK
jgi:N-methylhydantoinase A